MATSIVDVLEIDPKRAPHFLEGRPETESMLLAKDLRAEPLVFSDKGDSVYAVDRDGQIVQHSIPR